MLSAAAASAVTPTSRQRASVSSPMGQLSDAARRAELRERIREVRAGLQASRQKHFGRDEQVSLTGTKTKECYCKHCLAAAKKSFKNATKQTSVPTTTPTKIPPAQAAATKWLNDKFPPPPPPPTKQLEEEIDRIPETPPHSDTEEYSDNEGDDGYAEKPQAMEEEEEEDGDDEDMEEEEEEEDTEFAGTFEEFLAGLARTSEDDLMAEQRVRELIQYIPANEYYLEHVDDRDEVTISDKGFMLLCILINTPRSIAIWNQACKYINQKGPGKGNLRTVFQEAGLEPLIPKRTESNANIEKTSTNVPTTVKSPFVFESIEEMIDVVDEAWKLAAKGFKNKDEYEEETKWILSVKNNDPPVVPIPAPPTPDQKLKISPEAYESLRKISIEKLKRKSPPSSTSTTPEQGASPSGSRDQSPRREDPKKKRQKKKKNNTQSAKQRRKEARKQKQKAKNP